MSVRFMADDIITLRALLAEVTKDRDEQARMLAESRATLTAEIERLMDELERASITRHRCIGCGHTWDSILKGAELCGDCWRTARPTLHGPDTHDPLAEDYRRPKIAFHEPGKKRGPSPRLVKPPKKE